MPIKNPLCNRNWVKHEELAELGRRRGGVQACAGGKPVSFVQRTGRPEFAPGVLGGVVAENPHQIADLIVNDVTPLEHPEFVGFPRLAVAEQLAVISPDVAHLGMSPTQFLGLVSAGHRVFALSDMDLPAFAGMVSGCHDDLR